MKPCIGRKKVMKKRVWLILSIGLISLSFGGAKPSGTESTVVRGQGNQNYAGLWSGTWVNENGPAKGIISYTLSKDNKGQWRGTVNFKYQNQPEEYKADLQSLQIAGEKMKAKFEIVGLKGAREFTVEGQFQGNKLEGSAAISRRGSTVVTSKWAWKTTKSVAAKPEK
jgi:hypothetical protein